MIRFNIEGEYLEIPADFSVQLQKKNPLFAFDKLECERSVSFGVPATPKNDRIFALSKWIAGDGIGMRRRYVAQMQAGAVAKDGYLYVSTFQDGKYNCVFVTGELLGLQDIKALGKIADFMTFQDTCTVTDRAADMLRPSQAEALLYANVAYRKSSFVKTYTPSVSLPLLYDAIVQARGITAAPIPTECEGVRIIPTAPKGVDEEQTFTQTMIDPEQPEGQTPANPFNSLTFDGRLFEYYDEDYGVAIAQAGSIASNQYYLLRQFKAKTNLRIKFPNDWPDNLYLYDFTAGEFLGDRGFDKEPNQQGVTPNGDPLAGRTIDMPAETCFLVVNSDDFMYTRTSVMGSSYYDYGFLFSDPDSDFDRSFTLTVKSASGEVPVGDLVRLQDNLPDVTFTELLKIIAAISGKVLNYDDQNGITFDDLDFDTWPTFEVSDVFKRGEMARKFSDYAQQNTILFSSDDFIPEPERLSRVYDIFNENLEQEKQLLKIAFSEGQQLDNAIYFPEKPSKQTIAASGEQYLTRVTLPACAGIQRLCDASTAVQIQARMPMLLFERLSAKTAIYFDGVRYVWTEATWNKNAVTLKLSKIIA